MSDDLKRQAIFDLLSSDGWQLVEAFINERIEENKLRLITCKLDDIMNHRTKIVTFNSIYSFINEIKNMGVEDEIDESID